MPAEIVKNREDRLVVLNDIARSVIDKVRGQHPTYVFTYRNKPITRMLNSGWKVARRETGLLDVRVHDLKHTFGRRLRAAGVGRIYWGIGLAGLPRIIRLQSYPS